GARVTRVAAVSPSVTGGPVGGSPATTAVLVICPASTSACVGREYPRQGGARAEPVVGQRDAVQRHVPAVGHRVGVSDLLSGGTVLDREGGLGQVDPRQVD